MKRKTAYLVETARIEVREEELRRPSAGELLINVKAIGICGSDISYYSRGTSGMGYLTFPHVLGHECGGVVAAVGEGVADFAPGDRVAIEPGLPCGGCRECLSGRYNLCRELSFMSTAVVRPYSGGGMSDYVIRPARFVHKIPEQVTYEQAAMMEPISVAIHAVKRAGLIAGEKAAILGCGPIAGCILEVLQAAGISGVYMTDVVPERLTRMKDMGACQVYNVAGLSREQAEALLPEEVDAVFDTTCNEGAINASFKWLRKGGVFVQVGVPLGEKTLDMNTVFVKELSIITSFRYANTYPRALAMTAAGLLRPERLITHHFPLEQADEAMQFAAAKRGDVMKIILETE